MASTSVYNSTEVFLGANANLAIFGGRLQSNSIANANVVTIVGKLSNTSVRVSEPITAYNGQVITMLVPQLAVGSNAQAASATIKASSGLATPLGKTKGYLVGDGTGPNGMTVATGVAFPTKVKKGDYFLRLDFVPNRLFRWDGQIWRKVEDVLRSDLTPGSATNTTFRSQWLREETWTDIDGNTRSGISSLTNAGRPRADN